MLFAITHFSICHYDFAYEQGGRIIHCWGIRKFYHLRTITLQLEGLCLCMDDFLILCIEEDKCGLSIYIFI